VQIHHDRAASIVDGRGPDVEGQAVLALPSGGVQAGAGGHGRLHARGPKTVASRVPVQSSGGRGGANRRCPTGGLAYGMPRKITTSSSATPRRLPRFVGGSL
jgi:hypothetical protein